jgi:hypothetical protein
MSAIPRALKLILDMTVSTSNAPAACAPRIEGGSTNCGRDERMAGAAAVL